MRAKAGATAHPIPGHGSPSLTLGTGVSMRLRHRETGFEGVQLHPESILTPVGKGLLQNFMELPTRRVGSTGA
jgi:anthranilate/para-aminobenzoate synthase component II